MNTPGVLRRWSGHEGKIVSAASTLFVCLVLLVTYLVNRPDPPPFGANLSEPFKGTPAQDWADGEAGITAPRDQHGFTGSYERVREMLITARLDHRMLVDRDPDGMLAQFDPSLREWVLGALPFVSSRVQQGQKLLPVPPKVNGRMWAERDERGQVVVHTSYRFAYAFHTDMPQSVRNQSEIVALVRADVDYQPTGSGLWVSSTKGFTFSVSCEAEELGYLGPAAANRTLEQTTGQPEKWFAADAPMPTEDWCAK